jgi:DNA-binding response OmpR family regulator
MSLKLLVVDDEPDILKVLAARLKQNDFEVITACDGKMALVQADLHRPDLIIMDIMMPVMDGTEAAQMLKGKPKTQHIPIIFLSALKTSDDEGESTVGGNVILAKPFEIDTLLVKIRQMTSKY